MLYIVRRRQSVVTRCAALEHLSIQTSHTNTADGLSSLSDRVRLCKHLVTLSCPPLDWAAWKHLSNLPTLLTVSIEETWITPPWSLEQDIINFSPFLTVTALSFRLHSAAYSMTILHHSQFPSLKEFEINLDVLSSAEAEQLFRALSHCKACQTLEKITITLNDKYQPPPPGNSLTVIPHLLCFTQLRTLRLTCSNTFIYLDDDLLLEAISTWPHIRTLEIEDSGPHSSPVTFHALFTALRLRPQLRSLGVAISPVNIDIDTNAEPIQHSSLETLQLETSEFLIADPEAVAGIIFTWFPCINYAFGSTHDWEDHRDEVNKHLRSLKAAALHEIGAASNT